MLVLSRKIMYRYAKIYYSCSKDHYGLYSFSFWMFTFISFLPLSLRSKEVFKKTTGHLAPSFLPLSLRSKEV